MIEVWEYLDCESVGSSEIQSISEVIRGRFGDGAVETPARLARLLADEGAELRHAEVLRLDVELRQLDPYSATFKNILKFSNLKQARASINRLENLRRNYQKKNDREGLRRIRETVEKGIRRAEMISRNPNVDEHRRLEKAEIAEWFTLWLKQPEIFDDWLELRKRSPDYKRHFGDEA